MTSDTASDTLGPSAGVFPSEPDNAGAAMSLLTRKPGCWPRLSAPPVGGNEVGAKKQQKRKISKVPLSGRFLHQRWRGRRLAVWQGRVWVFTGGGEEWSQSAGFFHNHFEMFFFYLRRYLT